MFTQGTQTRRSSKEWPPSFVDVQPSQQDTENLETPELAQTDDAKYRRVIEKKFSEYIRNSRLLDDGPPARYQLRTKIINLDRLSDEESRLRRFTFGKRDYKYLNRTVLLVGATGSGKSTLINALVNFVMGVEFKDKVWFEIVPEEKNRPQTETQTTAVSVYEVFGFEGKTVPYSLTIIDTPGFGDTRGIESDDVITKKLQDLFCVPDGVNTIDAVGLVLKSTVNRLDERTAYIFNSVTSLFGRDMEQNIVALMTHSAGMKPKDALQALDKAKIKFARDENNEPVYFLFNNCQKEKIEDASDEAILKTTFETSENGMKTFTDFLGKSKPQSLKTTVEVLIERKRLMACIQNLKERVETSEMKQDVLKANQEEFSKLQSDKKKHKNVTIPVQEAYKEKEKIKNSKAVTCKRCEENCHYPGCTWAWNPSWCEVMKDGRCTSCSGKCPVKDHVKENWIYVTKTKTVGRGITKKYLKFGQIEKDLSELKEKKKQDLVKAFQLIQTLEEIALNVDSVYTYVHLDFLIENMEEIGDTEKVQTLERMRERMDKKNQAGAKYLQAQSFAEHKEMASTRRPSRDFTLTCL